MSTEKSERKGEEDKKLAKETKEWIMMWEENHCL